MRPTRPSLVLLAFFGVLWLASQTTAGEVNVAVFNFQMKSKTPEWVWLEKCLADQITTDLSRGAGFSVIARDSMQAVAHDIDWAPEMATGDAGKMGVIKKRLKIEYLISGVCVVKGDDISITGQIVSAASRRELFRKTVSGKVGKVIGLQKRLSAELLSWFTKRPADKILPTLPIWTKSIPAIRALYKGMDLYDRGRYAEGWLKFRQASRADEGYIEAVYWAGKMYYFMGRYRHARRSIEKFVYMDEAHPRISDAVREYVHTYETRDTDPDDILRMYDYFRKRMPNAIVRPESYEWPRTNVDRWLHHRTVAMLHDIGRYPEAARMVRPAFWNWRTAFGCVNVLLHNALTGKTLPAEVLAGPDDEPPTYISAGDGAGLTRTFVLWDGGLLVGEEAKGPDGLLLKGRPFLKSLRTLVAPSGYVFDSIRFSIKAQSGPVIFSAAAGKPCTGPKYFAGSVAIPVAQAVRDGVLLNKLPPTGYLGVWCSLEFSDQRGAIKVDHVTMVVKLRKLGPFGAIDVRCENTAAFRVYVDGVPSRWYPGIVGLLAEGEHTVTLHPASPSPLFLPWTTKVNVKAGKTTRVVGRLRRKPELSDWTIASIPCDYTGATRVIGTEMEFMGGIDKSVGRRDIVQPHRPAIHADDDAIRIIWSRNGDLWSSVSTDGKVFSPSAKLPLPVSTAWMEIAPRLVRDESGRFVLVFISDRDARHDRQLYATWSRDFLHWSEPALVPDSGGFGRGSPYGFLYDTRGRFILYPAVNRFSRQRFGGNDFLVSRDAYRWERLSGSPIGKYTRCCLVQRKDGQFERLGLARKWVRTKAGDGMTTKPLHFLGQQSTDGVKWNRPEVASYEGTWPRGDKYPFDSLSAVHVNGRSMMMRVGVRNMDSKAILLCREADGTCWQSSVVSGLIGGRPELIHHPKWGYIIAWILVGGDKQVGRYDNAEAMSYLPHPSDGPFVMCGGDLFKAFGATKPKPLTPANLSVLDGRVPGQKREEYDPLPMNSPLGKLHYFPARYNSGESIAITDPSAFTKVPPGHGTVSDRAIQVSFASKGLPFVVAVDWTDNTKRHPDIVRVDATGKGRFHNAPTMKMGDFMSTTGRGRAYWYRDHRVLIPFGSMGKVPVFMTIYYVPPENQAMILRMGYAAQAICRIGKRNYRVCLVNRDYNLRFGGPVGGKGPGKYVHGTDIIYVESGRRFMNLSHSDSWLDTGFMGHPVFVDGAFYEFVVSDDGKNIQAKPYAGAMGKIKIDHPAWEALFHGKQRFWVRGRKAPVAVPVGDYTMRYYKEWTSLKLRLDKPAGQIGLTAPEQGAFKIREGETTTLTIGSPLNGAIVFEREGNELLLGIKWKDCNGNELGRGAFQQPVIQIAGLDGKVLRTVPPEISVRRRWKIPEGFKGTFILKAGDDAPFGATIKPSKVTIE